MESKAKTKYDLEKMTKSAMTFTEEVTTRWDSRIVGSQACLDCGDYLLDSFASFCDTTRKHEFEVHPASFLAFFKISVVFYFLTLIALWASYIGIAVIISTISIIFIITHFLFYKEIIDFLYPKEIGQNIVGAIEPKGEVKQQIIISAHHDSAHIFNFLADDPDSYVRRLITTNVSIFGIATVTWILWVLQLASFEMGYVVFVIAGIFSVLSYWVGNLWFFYSEEGTPGAGDNMVCTALAMEVGKYFSQQKKEGHGLQHTRVIVASWDAEEAGLRGARAYIKKYHAELKDVKTYNFNLECMYDHRELAFLTSDLNSFVSLSEPMIDECVAIGKDLNYDFKKLPFPLFAGGTDAAEFAKAGIEATTLAAMNWTTRGDVPAYHTPRDTIEAVDDIAVSRSIELGIAYFLEKDRQVRIHH